MLVGLPMDWSVCAELASLDGYCGHGCVYSASNLTLVSSAEISWESEGRGTVTGESAGP